MITTARPLTRPPATAPWIEHLVAPDRIPSPWESGLHHLTWSCIRFGVTRRFSLTVHGTEHFPSHGPAIIVANHCSHLDTLLIASMVPRRLRSRLSPLAAGDTFFRNPAQGWLSSRFLNLRPLWRHKRSPHHLLRLREGLESHDPCYLVFPEGTRSRDGEMAHFKPGIGMLVAGTRVPIIPCHIRGTFEAWPPHRRTPSKGTLSLTVGKPRTFPAHAGNTRDWRDIAHSLEDDIRQLAS